ncbi:hypothetical protein T484DRAFT_1796227, partial [Baffinella frigidus]
MGRTMQDSTNARFGGENSSSTSLAVPSLSRLVVPFLLLFVLAAPANAMEKCDSPLKVLVTGASGYLGQFLLDAVLAENASPAGRRPLDVAGTYSTRPKGIPEGIRALKMDLADAKSVEESLSSFAPDAVINLAATSAALNCEKNKDHAGHILFLADVVINLAAMSAPLACEKNKDEA